MANLINVKLYANSSAESKVGFYSSSTSKGNYSVASKCFSNSFSSCGCDFDTIDINSVLLYCSFSKSGNSGKKTYDIELRNSSNSAALYTLFDVRTIDAAYNSTTYFNLNSYKAQIQDWLASGGKYIYFRDKGSVSYHSSSAAYWSANYVKVKASYFNIDYQDKKVEFTIDGTSINIPEGTSVNISDKSDSRGSNEYSAEVQVNGKTISVGLTCDESSSSEEVYECVGTLTFPTDIPLKATSTSAILIFTAKNGSEIVNTTAIATTLIINSYDIFKKSSTSTFPNIMLGGITTGTFKITIEALYGNNEVNNVKFYLKDAESSTIYNTVTYTATDNVYTANILAPSVSKPTAFNLYCSCSSEYFTTTWYYTTPFYVNPSTIPVLEISNLYRYDGDSRNDISGEKFYMDYSVSGFFEEYLKYNGKESFSNSYSLYYKTDKNDNEIKIEESISEEKEGTFISEEEYDKNIAYSITFILKENTTGLVYTFTGYSLPTSSFLLHFKKNTNSVGIGCLGSDPGIHSGLISLGWPTQGLEILGNQGDSILDFNELTTLTDLKTVLGIGPLTAHQSDSLNLYDDLVLQEYGSSIWPKIAYNKSNINYSILSVNSNGITLGNSNCDLTLTAANNYFSFNGTNYYYLPVLEDGKSCEILTTKYKVGETVTIKNAKGYGYITSQRTSVWLHFPLSDLFPKNATYEVSSLIGEIRVGGYYLKTNGSDGNAGGVDFSSVIEKTDFSKETSVLIVHLVLTNNANTDTNNCALAFQGTITLTLSEPTTT